MDDKFETLGQLIDKLDNLQHALNIPLDPKLHVEQCQRMLKETVIEFKQSFIDITGENPWD